MAWPDVSVRVPFITESDTVRIATRILEMRALFVERSLLDDRRNALASYLDLECSSRRGALSWQVRSPDGNPKRWTHGAAAHFAACGAVDIHVVSRSRKRSLSCRKACELFLDACFLLFDERVPSDKVTLLELHQPLQVCLERSDGIVDVVSVERHSHLEAQRVARPQSRRNYITFLENRIPHAHSIFVREVQLESVFPGVSGPRDDDVTDPRNRSPREVVVLDRRQIDIGQALKNLYRLWPLKREKSRLIADVLERGIDLRQLPRDVRKILPGIRGVHHHHELVCLAIHQAVVLD